jgi:hypothetical protein
MDKTVLCDILEYTFGSFAVSMNYQHPEVRREGSLHKVVLPRSWLRVHLEKLKRGILVDMSLSYVLVEPVSELLQNVYSQSREGLFPTSFIIIVDT